MNKITVQIQTNISDLGFACAGIARYGDFYARLGMGWDSGDVLRTAFSDCVVGSVRSLQLFIPSTGMPFITCFLLSLHHFLLLTVSSFQSRSRLLFPVLSQNSRTIQHIARLVSCSAWDAS
ncbi:hypothetical protein BT96DRAFT_505184 [Gymnopus androsaceus JB14]|uniref:Uncharacterized protein n=1 Tax=Gymnopus androsaceus JB14 TaxID=1447944 RepID=A0A6A4HYN8_9AGAR|nr:hypothetical protein BT96DRAFT_505184 [Gymnopus androsaceus JB14]